MAPGYSPKKKKDREREREIERGVQWEGVSGGSYLSQDIGAWLVGVASLEGEDDKEHGSSQKEELHDLFISFLSS